MKALIIKVSAFFIDPDQYDTEQYRPERLFCW